MLGDFFSFLAMLLGYAYPAFQCFKAMERMRPEALERMRPDIQELKFWCKYWIIVALVTVFERMGAESLVSWLPMYGAMKLAFFVYLWHPEKKGATSVYDTWLRPFIAQHERAVDQMLLRAGAPDAWRNFSPPPR